MIYFVIILYLSVLVWIYDAKTNKYYAKSNYIIAYLVLTSLVAFRYRVGGDTINYIIGFDLFTPELSDLNLFEVTKRQPIPALIFSICKTYFNDFVYVQIIFAVFVNWVMFKFIKENCKYKFTAIWLYAVCFFMRFNCEIMRESLAISFFLLGYKYLVSRKLFKYYIFVFLALMSHLSAVFLIVLPIFYSGSNLKTKLLYGILFFIIMAIVSQSYLFQILSMYAETYTQYESSIFGKLAIILFQVIIPLYVIKLTKSYISTPIIKGAYIYILCGIASLFIYIFYRFNNYVIIFYLILGADLLNHVTNKKISRESHLLRNAFYTILICFGFVSSYFTSIERTIGKPERWYVCWYPYYSIFNPNVSDVREEYISNLEK